jgi:cytochrome c-type biogenesis protein CcmH
MILRNFIFNKIFFFIVFSSLIFLNATHICYAVEPEEFLKDKKQELRARDISKNVRCLVCQNQSIDESFAPLAKDLRIIIRNKIEKGQTDEEIYTFLTDRYGDFILLNPPFKANTIVLWIFPLLLFILCIFVIYRHNKKSIKR